MGKVIKLREQPIERLLRHALELVEKGEVRECYIFMPDAKNPDAFQANATTGMTLKDIALARASIEDLERKLFDVETGPGYVPDGDAS